METVLNTNHDYTDIFPFAKPWTSKGSISNLNFTKGSEEQVATDKKTSPLFTLDSKPKADVNQSPKHGFLRPYKRG